MHQQFCCCTVSFVFLCYMRFQRIIVGISATSRSLVTFFGIRKNIVVQACCALLSSRLLLRLQLLGSRFSPCFFRQIQGNLWVEPLTSHSCFLPCGLTPPSPDHFLEAMASPPTSSVPHFPLLLFLILHASASWADTPSSLHSLHLEAQCEGASSSTSTQGG